MFETPRHFHFIGICGTAMGSVAAALRERGCTVTGSDENVYPPMSTFLAENGVGIASGYRADNIPAGADLIVVGNAIKRGNPEVESVLDRKLPYLSLPETLKYFFLRGRHNLVVTGTHGKTTTTSMLAWIFEHAGRQPGFLIGGLPANLGCGARLNDGKFFIIEGDEYDTAFFDKRPKFLHYLPELVVVNNIEFDHADIYKDLTEIQLGFQRLLNIVPQGGMVLLNGDDPNAIHAARACLAPLVEVGFSDNAGTVIRDMRHTPEGSHFTLLDGKFFLPMPGEFNVRNAAMAVCAAHFYGITIDTIREALAGFKGVRRRQEIKGEVRGVLVMDDFGHHPTAIRQTLQALRIRFSGRRLWAVFEPRSNTTRRAVFQNDLPEALGLADVVCLAQVARLEQIPAEDRLDPGRVVADLRAMGRTAFYEPGADDIVSVISKEALRGDVVVIFSNGGFDGIHRKLLDALAL